ncbi:MAG: J domain-containing protein [Calditrichaeota bacterium]|nr:J domain-containing protein [Calditrichota bacterium]
MSRHPDPYAVLGLAPSADLKEVRAAFRRLARIHHPDANPGDARADALFRRAREAYEQILSSSKARRSEAARGRDVKVRVFLTLPEAFLGCRKTLRYPQRQDGEGFPEQTREVSVQIPAGVRDGSSFRYADEGHMGPGGAGSLVVIAVLKPDRYFEVRGNNLHYSLLVGIDSYVEGGQSRLPHPGGTISIDIPPRFVPGMVLKLAGRGLPAYDGHPAGDLLVKLDLCLPKKLSRRERETLSLLLELPGFKVPVDEQGFQPRE